jgi:hypothetical protein
MTPHREGAQVGQVVRWIEQARDSKGRFRPTLSVGRDGIFVPLRGGVAQEGATATVSVLDRRGKRVGTVYLGQMPESGQGTITDPLSGLLKAILTQVDSQSLRWVYVSDEGHHPSTYYHQVLKKMVDPRRPWRHLEWIRIVDFYLQELANEIACACKHRHFRLTFIANMMVALLALFANELTLFANCLQTSLCAQINCKYVK